MTFVPTIPTRWTGALLLLALAVFSGCDSSSTVPPEPPPVCERAPLPEPDASTPVGTLLVTSRRDGTKRLWAARPDGTFLDPITPSRLGAYNGTWSPDMTEVVFLGDSLGVTADDVVYRMRVKDINGSDVQALYIRPEDDGSGNPVPLRGRDPTWSPDGRYVALTTCRFYAGGCIDEDVVTVNLVADTFHWLTDHLTSDYGPAWSPDGQQIAFLSERDYEGSGPYVHDLYVMDADGSNQTRLTFDTDASASSPVWSPDGKRIAYSLSGGQIMMYDLGCGVADSLAHPQVGPNIIPQAWSPDGRYLLAMTQPEAFLSRLYKVNVADGSVEQLFTDDDRILYVDWSRQ